MSQGHVLITGIRGAVGGHLAFGLQKLGYRVSGTSRSSEVAPLFARHDINVFALDPSQDDWASSLPLSDVDAIVHLAGPMPARGNPTDESIIRDIVVGTVRMLDFARRVRASKVLFGQSRADTAHLQGTLDPIDPDVCRRALLTGDHSTYSIAKNAATDLVLAAGQHDLTAFVIRMSTIYAYQPDPYFVVDGIRKPRAYRLMIERTERGLPVTIWGDPTRRKEIVFVSEFIRLVQHILASSSTGGVFNVGDGVGVTIEDQVRGIAEVFSPGVPVPVMNDPAMPDARQFLHDVRKNRIELGYTSQLTYLDGLREYRDDMTSQVWDALWGPRVLIPASEL